MSWEVRQGDALSVLREMEAGTVQTCVTSPPYWGLRDYGDEGQLGLEPTPDQYVANLVEVFREVRRVLREDGTVWLNLGDSYAGGPAASGGVQRLGPNGDLDNQRNDVQLVKRSDGLKPKKPNPMPESVRDRPTRSHEYIFMLSKSARYFWDQEAVREEGEGRLDRWPGSKGRIGRQGWTALAASYARRNIRSVWNIATQPYKEAHFATFPYALVEPCVLAGSAEGDTVLDPFAGSGTVGVVALRRGRSFIGIELNAEYCEMARLRIRDDAPLLNTGLEAAA